MSRSREEEGRTPSLCHGCRDREGRGEFPPPHAVDIEIERGEPPHTVDIKNKDWRGEFSPPRAVDVKIERGGGEKPLLTPWLSRSRGEGRVLPYSRRGCRDQEGRGG